MPCIPYGTVVTWRKHKRQNYFQMLCMNPSIWLIRKMPGSGYLLWQVLFNREWRCPMRSRSRALAGLQLIDSCATAVQPENAFMVPLVTARGGVTNESRNAALPLCTLILYWAPVLTLNWEDAIWPWMPYIIYIVEHLFFLQKACSLGSFLGSCYKLRRIEVKTKTADS